MKTHYFTDCLVGSAISNKFVAYQLGQEPRLIEFASEDLTNKRWYTLTVADNQLFQMHTYGGRNCRLLSLQNNIFKSKDLAARERENWFPSICLIKELRTILVMGGSLNSEQYKTVEKYRFSENIWDKIANMHVKRAGASSCYHRGFVYIFCGITTGSKKVSSFERLNTDSLQSGAATFWELFQPTPTQLKPRMDCAVLPINYNEIIICGGSGTSDVVLFDITTMSWRTIIPAGQIEFFCQGNQSARVANDHVIVQANVNRMIEIKIDEGVGSVGLLKRW